MDKLEQRCLVIKVIGVAPEELPKLHRYMNSDSLVASEPWIEDTFDMDLGIGKCQNRFRYAETLSSRLDKTHGTYTVEIKVVIETTLDRNGSESKVLLTPRTILESLFDTLNIFPPNEMRAEKKYRVFSAD